MQRNSTDPEIQKNSHRLTRWFQLDFLMHALFNEPCDKQLSAREIQVIRVEIRQTNYQRFRIEGTILFLAALVISRQVYEHQVRLLSRTLLLKTANERLEHLSAHDPLTGLVSRADKALYLAKKQGRNQVVSA